MAMDYITPMLSIAECRRTLEGRAKDRSDEGF
jgi:hypothetical protein